MFELVTFFRTVPFPLGSRIFPAWQKKVKDVKPWTIVSAAVVTMLITPAWLPNTPALQIHAFVVRVYFILSPRLSYRSSLVHLPFAMESHRCVYRMPAIFANSDFQLT